MANATYTEFLNRVKGLSGVFTPSADQLTYFVHLLNRRANMAYEATDYWPRYLIAGETRTVTNNVVAFTESGKSEIDTFLRIHKTYQPFYLYSAVELEYYVNADGAHLVGDTAPSTSTYVTYKKVWDGPYTNASTNIPYEWLDHLAHAVYADYLRQDGQNEKAIAEENIAKGILDDQLQKTDVSRATGMMAHRISTHNSRSFRR
jgi:hypothetical protein